MTNGAEKVSFLQSRLALVNSKIAKSEIQALEDGADVVTYTLIKEQVGSASWMTLKTRANELGAAEALRDRLATSLKETQAMIEQEKDAKAQGDAKRPALDVYAAELKVIRGNRYAVQQGLGMEIFQHIMNQIPPSEYVDRVSLYKSMEGLDGTTTTEALSRDRHLFIGKYYVLQGDVFQIQADRDYPREGRSQFSVFGRANLVGDYFVPVNVDCISAEKVPPYSIAPILGRIIDFRFGRNGAGKSIIVPVMQVVAIASPSADQKLRCINVDGSAVRESGKPLQPRGQIRQSGSTALTVSGDGCAGWGLQDQRQDATRRQQDPDAARSPQKVAGDTQNSALFFVGEFAPIRSDLNLALLYSLECCCFVCDEFVVLRE